MVGWTGVGCEWFHSMKKSPCLQGDVLVLDLAQQEGMEVVATSPFRNDTHTEPVATVSGS